jgi:Zn-dependent protease/CBS domain-containing protein
LIVAVEGRFVNRSRVSDSRQLVPFGTPIAYHSCILPQLAAGGRAAFSRSEGPLMNWSWRVGRLAGIPLYIHWTFLLLLIWFGGQSLMADGSISAALVVIGMIVACFACIVLHELGHALAARRFGVSTKDITLLPIGGVARLERIPEEPGQELIIALAGPAVNVAIAAVTVVLLVILGSWQSWHTPFGPRGSFLMSLLFFNVFVVLFNMLPAFPMDGGRVLRALLATRMSHVRATRIAANVGQFMAMAFAFVGIFGFFGLFQPNPFLIFIALFVYLGAEAEARAVQFKDATSNIPVHAAMMTRFQTLSPDDSLQTAAQELLAGAQQDFPVLDDGRVVGLLCRDDLMRGLSEGGASLKVRDVLRSDVLTVDSSAVLTDVIQQLQRDGCRALPVVQNGRLVGLLTAENLGELVSIRAAMNRDAAV